MHSHVRAAGERSASAIVAAALGSLAACSAGAALMALAPRSLTCRAFPGTGKVVERI
jgi:hypothetical protein